MARTEVFVIHSHLSISKIFYGIGFKTNNFQHFVNIHVSMIGSFVDYAAASFFCSNNWNVELHFPQITYCSFLMYTYICIYCMSEEQPGRRRRYLPHAKVVTLDSVKCSTFQSLFLQPLILC